MAVIPFIKQPLQTHCCSVTLPEVNFINILCAACTKKLQSQTREKLHKTLWYEKATSKMLMIRPCIPKYYPNF